MGITAGQDALGKLKITVRIKRTRVYENIRIYNTIIVVKLLHVSVTFYGHLQEGFFFLEGYITKAIKQIIYY